MKLEKYFSKFDFSIYPYFRENPLILPIPLRYKTKKIVLNIIEITYFLFIFVN
jgi:hypothetical protein